MHAIKPFWQARRDSNPQHPILETGALPIELLTCSPLQNNYFRICLACVNTKLLTLNNFSDSIWVLIFFDVYANKISADG